MRLPFFLKSNRIPFDKIQEHAEKVKECGWSFQQAVECHIAKNCTKFDEYHQDVDNLEHEADDIKRLIRASIPKYTGLPVREFQLFMYVREQDKVLDSVQDSLNWISYRLDQGIPEGFSKYFIDLVNAVMSPIEELSIMVAEAIKYFQNRSDYQRNIVIDIINSLRKSEHDVDKLQDALKLNIFAKETDPVAVFYMVTLTDVIGAIADHAENAGDMMRVMITK